MIEQNESSFNRSRGIKCRSTRSATAPEVKRPTAVRFGWDEVAQPNLFSEAGLPARPFRTDKTQ